MFTFRLYRRPHVGNHILNDSIILCVEELHSVKLDLLIIQKNIYIFSFYKNKTGQAQKLKHIFLEARVCSPLWGRLGSTLLELVAELLGVRILQGFDRHRRLGPRLPLCAALVHHRGFHGDSVSAKDGKIKQELGAEVVVVGLHSLLDLISFSVEWDLKARKYGKVIGKGATTELQCKVHRFKNNKYKLEHMDQQTTDSGEYTDVFY